MTRLNIEIQDGNIAEKIFWMLQHFKNDGVSIERIDSDDIDVLTSLRTSLEELREVKRGNVEPQRARDFLNEL